MYFQQEGFNMGNQVLQNRWKGWRRGWKRGRECASESRKLREASTATAEAPIILPALLPGEERNPPLSRHPRLTRRIRNPVGRGFWELLFSPSTSCDRAESRKGGRGNMILREQVPEGYLRHEYHFYEVQKWNNIVLGHSYNGIPEPAHTGLWHPNSSVFRNFASQLLNRASMKNYSISTYNKFY